MSSSKSRQPGRPQTSVRGTGKSGKGWLGMWHGQVRAGAWKPALIPCLYAQGSIWKDWFRGQSSSEESMEPSQQVVRTLVLSETQPSNSGTGPGHQPPLASHRCRQAPCYLYTTLPQMILCATAKWWLHTQSPLPKSPQAPGALVKSSLICLVSFRAWLSQLTASLCTQPLPSYAYSAHMLILGLSPCPLPGMLPSLSRFCSFPGQCNPSFPVKSLLTPGVPVLLRTLVPKILFFTFYGQHKINCVCLYDFPALGPVLGTWITSFATVGPKL